MNTIECNRAIEASLLGQVELYRRYRVTFREPLTLQCQPYCYKARKIVILVFFRDTWGRLCYRAPNRSRGYWVDQIYDKIETLQPLEIEESLLPQGLHKGRAVPPSIQVKSWQNRTSKSC